MKDPINKFCKLMQCLLPNPGFVCPVIPSISLVQFTKHQAPSTKHHQQRSPISPIAPIAQIQCQVLTPPRRQCTSLTTIPTPHTVYTRLITTAMIMQRCVNRRIIDSNYTLLHGGLNAWYQVVNDDLFNTLQKWITAGA